MLLVWHTVGGILALIAGVIAARYVGRAVPRFPHSFIRPARITAWTAGLGLAALSFIFAGDIGYAVSTPEGSDYVGWITYVGILGNVVVWLLLPQLVLAMYLRMRGNALTPNTSFERTREG